MPAKKVDARLDAVEEQMEKVRSDLQKLDHLEKGIVSILDRMTALDQVIQKLEAPTQLTVMAVDRGKAEVDDSTNHPLKFSPDEGGVSSVGGRESPMGADLVCRLEMPVFDGANPEGWIF